MLLMGKSLGERQKDLNFKVNNATERKVDFEEIKKQKESSDIDKIFKIDVASKYKDINYILEILKSGDDLHISRALRGKWLYDNKLSHIINPDYLQENIFPHMSFKMQRKMLTAISVHIQDQSRVEIFFKYCLTSQQQPIELKFLRLMSEKSRLDFINGVEVNWEVIEKKLEHVVGDSFILAEACIQKVNKFKRDKTLHRLRHLYSVSQQKYLDLLEKYAEMDLTIKLGLRISKDIAIKHKDRILAHPLLYLQKLNTSILIKHSKKEEVKLFAKTWLPNEVTKFWKGKYCTTHKEILKGIPIDERFEFVKAIFTEKYPGEQFESNDQFYTSESYIIMTKKQKILWALQNLEQEKAVCKDNSYFKWYKLLPFEMVLTAFKEEFGKDKSNESLETLIKACKSQSDLEMLFEYYLENLKTEVATIKTHFVNSVQQAHKVFKFKGKCWELFQEVLLDSDVVELSRPGYPMTSTETVVFLYHIIHDKEMPNELKSYKETKSLYVLEKYYGITKSQTKKVKKYLLENKLVDDEMLLLDDEMCEETLKELVRKLKKDVDLVKPSDVTIESLTNFKKYRLTKLLKKLKVYFPFDTATKEYLELFHNCLRNGASNPDSDLRQNIIFSSVAGIILLSNEADLKNFIIAHAPKSGAKFNWKEFKPSVLIQQAICTYAYLSRPLLDPKLITKYVTGDYVEDCMPLLKAFAVNLPFNLGIKFIEILLKAPDKKIQRRALKLAVRYFPEEAMYPLFLKVWETTNDKKLRKILYEVMSTNLMILNDQDQIKMYKDFFRPMTLGLRKDELAKRIGILNFDLPDSIRGIHLETMWDLSRKLGNMKSCLLKDIASDISYMDKEFMDKIVNEYIQENWTENKLVRSHMSIIAAYLIFYTEKEELEKTVEFADLTMTKFIDLYVKGTPTEKVMIWQFLSELAQMNCDIERKQRQYHTSNEILTKVLNQLFKSIPFENVSYLCFWQIKLAIIWNKTMDLGNEKLENKDLDKKTIAKELMQYYADEVKSTIEDLVATGHYNKIEIRNVAKSVSDNLKNMSLNLRNSSGLIWLNFYIFFVERLVSFGKEETHILGLHVLPNQCAVPACALDYGKLLENIGLFDSTEVQALLKQRFDINSRKRRPAANE